MRRLGDYVNVLTLAVVVMILGLMLWRRSQSCGAPINVEPLEQTIAYQSQLIRDQTDAILKKLDTTDAGSKALQSDQIWRGRFESIVLRLEAIEQALRGRRPIGQTSQSPDQE